MHVDIWHNPKCGTSRNTLALIRHAGIEPTVIDYLATPPTKARLADAIAAAGLSVREAIRAKEAIHAELGLDDAALSDDAFLARSYEVNRQGLDLLQGEFERLGLEYVPSFGNFVLVRVGDGGAVYEKLLRGSSLVEAICVSGTLRIMV